MVPNHQPAHSFTHIPSEPTRLWTSFRAPGLRDQIHHTQGKGVLGPRHEKRPLLKSWGIQKDTVENMVIE